MTPLPTPIVQLDFLLRQYRFNGAARALNLYISSSPAIGPPNTGPITVETDGLLINCNSTPPYTGYHGAACHQADIMEAIRTAFVGSPNLLTILRVKIVDPHPYMSGFPYTAYLAYVLLGGGSVTLFVDFTVAQYSNPDDPTYPVPDGTFASAFSSGDPPLGEAFAVDAGTTPYEVDDIFQIATYFTGDTIYTSINGNAIFTQTTASPNDPPTLSVDAQFAFENDNLASLDGQTRHVQQFGVWTVVVDPPIDLPLYSDPDFNPFPAVTMPGQMILGALGS